MMELSDTFDFIEKHIQFLQRINSKICSCCEYIYVFVHVDFRPILKRHIETDVILLRLSNMENH